MSLQLAQVRNLDGSANALLNLIDRSLDTRDNTVVAVAPSPSTLSSHRTVAPSILPTAAQYDLTLLEYLTQYDENRSL